MEEEARRMDQENARGENAGGGKEAISRGASASGEGGILQGGEGLLGDACSPPRTHMIAASHTPVGTPSARPSNRCVSTWGGGLLCMEKKHAHTHTHTIPTLQFP